MMVIMARLAPADDDDDGNAHDGAGGDEHAGDGFGNGNDASP